MSDNTKEAASSSDLTVPEFAEALGIGTSTTWRWIKDGRVRVVRYGRRLTRIPREEPQRVRDLAMRGEWGA